MKNLYAAMHQWAVRPSDERYWNLTEMHAATLEHRNLSVVREVPLSDIRVEADQDDIQIVGRKDKPAHFSHYAFGQLCSRAGAPASFLRTLPPTLAAQNLNHCIKRAFGEGDVANILLRRNGTWHVQAMLSGIYERIWNHQVVEFLQALPPGWRVPPARPASPDAPSRPATQQDVLDDRGGGGGLSVKVGDRISPAGLYASDHDMFAFLVNESVSLEAAPGGRESLSRGFFIRNSEVGDSSISLTMFYYEHVCGNHIVWGARDVVKFSLRHVGEKARDWHRGMQQAIRLVSSRSTADDTRRLQAARTRLLGSTQEQVVDFVAERIRVMSRRRAEEVYRVAAEHEHVHGDPRSVWGFASGITRHSQQVPYADDRFELERAATRVLDVAFSEVL